LHKTFEAVARKRKLSMTSYSLGQAVLNLKGGFLQPDVLMKIWQALHHH
jgi:hypothetical protein